MTAGDLSGTFPYWYGIPPWAIWGGAQVPGSKPIQSKRELSPIQPIKETRPPAREDKGEFKQLLYRPHMKDPPVFTERTGYAHLGHNIDIYA